MFNGGLLNQLGLIMILLAAIPFNGSALSADVITVLAVDYPPFELENPVDGLHGHDHEVVLEAFQRKGLPAEIIYMPWTRAVSDSRNGLSPGLLSCAYNDDRAQVYYFSDPISTDVYGLYYRRGFQPDSIRNFNDLRGKSVAAVAGYIGFEALAKAGVDPIDVRSDIEGLKMLKLGRFDYLYSGKPANDFHIMQLGMSEDFDFLELQGWDQHLCLSKAFPGAQDLLKVFNEGLAEIKADGTYQAIHARYFGSS